MRSLLVAVAGLLLLAAPASAGGWATAGLGPPDGGVGAGDTWNAVITIKQHGMTPLVGVEPSVIISDGDETLTFPAHPTGKPGVYAAQVKFPNEGTWRYQVNDGFSQTHSFPSVQIGAGDGGGGFSIPDWTWGIVFAALGLAAMYLLARRTRATQAPVAQP
jgi:hypothetical protein